MDTDSPKIYFEAEYSYSRKGVLLIVSLLAAFGLFAVWKGSAGLSSLNIGTVIISGICFGLSVWFLVQFVRRRTLVSRIDSQGITCDGKLWPWERVSWLAGHTRPDGIHLFFQARGLMCFDRTIWTNRALTDAEYSEILEKIGSEVKVRFPEVRFG